MFIYYFLTIKNEKYLKVSILFSFYLIIFVSVGLHNYKRMGLFYVIPTETKYGVYKYFSKARIYLGISRSDGVSTSLLEAMALGTFPIQSSTSCADEWIKNGKSGFLVKNNISIISQKLLKALKDDNLVNNASKINLNTIKKKANSKKVRAIIRNFYK